MDIEKLETPLPTLSRGGRSQCQKIREHLIDLAVSEGIRIVFDTSKKSMGSYIAYVIRPLAPRKYSYRTLDDETSEPGKVIGIWRIK